MLITFHLGTVAQIKLTTIQHCFQMPFGFVYHILSCSYISIINS